MQADLWNGLFLELCERCTQHHNCASAHFVDGLISNHFLKKILTLRQMLINLGNHNCKFVPKYNRDATQMKYECSNLPQRENDTIVSDKFWRAKKKTNYQLGICYTPPTKTTWLQSTSLSQRSLSCKYWKNLNTLLLLMTLWK